jgi:hypothetical protein
MHVIKKKQQKDYFAFIDNLKSKESNSKKLLLSKIYHNFFLKKDQVFLGFSLDQLRHANSTLLVWIKCILILSRKIFYKISVFHLF